LPQKFINMSLNSPKKLFLLFILFKSIGAQKVAMQFPIVIRFLTKLLSYTIKHFAKFATIIIQISVKKSSYVTNRIY